MAEVKIAYVKVSKSWRGFRTTAYGGNGEKIVWSESYKDKRDAVAVAEAIAQGVPIEEP